jgi:DNA polymerase-1
MIVNEESVDHLISRLEQSHMYCLDVETFKTDTFDGKKLLGVAIGVPRGLDLDTYYVPANLFPRLHSSLADREMVGFSLMFDLEICEQNGLCHTGFIWDVQVMMHLCNENEFQFSLDALSLRYLQQRKGVRWGDGIVSIDDFEKIYTWNKIPQDIMATYAEQDISLTWQLFIRARAELERQQLTKIYMSASKYVRSLQRMVKTGLLVDWDKLESRRTEVLERMEKLEAVIGFQPSKRKQLHALLYDELGLPIIKYTKSGQPAQDVDVLNRLAEDYPEYEELLQNIIEWKQGQKEESTWLTGFTTRKTAQGRIHPGLKQHGTKTGRLSCAEPNLQQLPREGKRGKDLFTAEPGYALVEFDYAGVELRIASSYAAKFGDDRMYQMFLAESVDVHAETAKAIGAYEQVVNPYEARQVGKTGNFSWIYGVGPAGFSSQLYKLYRFRCSIEQAREWTELFHETYPGFRITTRKYADFHRKSKYVEGFNKRRFRIREINVRNGETKHYTAFNRVVQGGAGQCLMYATNSISRAIHRGELDAKAVLSVHDSLWFYIKQDDLEPVSKQITTMMQEVPEKVFKMPFPIDRKVLYG